MPTLCYTGGMKKRIDMTGLRFGSWEVLGLHARPPLRHAMWLCRCSCGVHRPVSGPSLRNGTSVSCGHDVLNRFLHMVIKHGMAGTKPHMVWCTMRQRCLNPRNKDFANYGGRGISIYPAWVKFEAFWQDMGATYRAGLTIERMDVNGDYCPGNCTWVPPSAQSGNRRPPSEWRRRNESGTKVGRIHSA